MDQQQAHYDSMLYIHHCPRKEREEGGGLLSFSRKLNFEANSLVDFHPVAPLSSSSTSTRALDTPGPPSTRSLAAFSLFH
jgi:hypothetical protein